ncbi:MAG: 30S ribosomal protein S16 [Candidatus Liptonbacteria bacterium]|nr:30S ribosomal protein S16 [Candidatus Liptonbacteria bacterium]
MLTIKFQRSGRKHEPRYRIVVGERRSKIGGPPLEDLGFYNPIRKDAGLNAERIRYWISVGAKPSRTVHNLLVKKEVISGGKIPVPIAAAKKKSVPEKGAHVAPLAVPPRTSPEEGEPPVAEGSAAA